MRPNLLRLSSAALLGVCAVLISGASRTNEPVLQPNKLVIISTTDVKGKTSPCG